MMRNHINYKAVGLSQLNVPNIKLKNKNNLHDLIIVVSSGSSLIHNVKIRYLLF